MDHMALTAIEIFVDCGESSPPAHGLSNGPVSICFFDLFGMVIYIWRQF